MKWEDLPKVMTKTQHWLEIKTKTQHWLEIKNHEIEEQTKGTKQ